MSDALKSSGAEFWDENPCGGTWRSYREYTNWIRETEPYIFRILEQFDWNGVRTLEVGCGQGATLNYLAEHGARMIGIDMSEVSLLGARAGARELGVSENVRLARADAEHLPFAEGSFDRVISIGVLHHTPDIAGAIEEIRRALRPGGTAIIMLYRTGNPKWWATRTARGISRMVDAVAGKRYAIADRIRRRRETNSLAGTALLELFGVPTLRAYSNRRVRAMFRHFSSVRITNHEPGFRRLPDIARFLHPLKPLFRSLDAVSRRVWGFYQVIELTR
ncbi:MAG TPA: class I SAM-dependent methyltransferase [Thermoanaerobaculia bacterium]|nr:class I SAM-dependent methyltransferase [Thermoanaerobaculia bacterium]